MPPGPSPKFTDIRGEITSAIATKHVTGRCPLCGNLQWTLAEGFVYVTLQPDFAGVYVGGSGGLPGVALICTNCGNTHILNLVVLGLGHHFGVTAAPQPASR